MGKGYMTDMYKQLEEISKKLDKSLSKITEQSLTIYELQQTIKELNKTIQEKDKKIELLLEENEKLKNKNNKNSSNSSKPPSSDMFKPPKSGANLYNSRTKSNKKSGGQLNHEGHSLTKEKVEKKLEENRIHVVEIKHQIHGNPSQTPLVKYRLGVEMKTIVEKHIFEYANTVKEKLPKEFYTDVTYSDELKGLVLFLNIHNAVSLDRTAEFFSVVSKGLINLSEGTIVNFIKEFSKKSTSSIDNIVEDILLNTKMFTDETTEKVEKRNGAVRNYSNEQSVVYKSHFHKGHEPIKEDGILTKYTGTVMGDHDTTLNSYGAKRIECNVHLGRYAKEITQNVFDAPWAERMRGLLETGNRTREFAKEFGLERFNEADYERYSKKYDEILEQAKEETKNMSSTFYKGKSRKLYTRLEHDKEKHLAFLKDFSLAYSNNLSESDLRVYKIKLKVSGGFRSKEGSDCYADALSIIKTSKKRKENVLDNLIQVFQGKTLFAQ